MKRNNSWVNPWNPVLSFLIWSNHDINFLPTKMKALVIIHYITNYATKGDCSQYKHIMSAAIVRKPYEDAQAKATATITPVRYADLDRFALQTFNRLAYEREVSRPLVASCLLTAAYQSKPYSSLFYKYYFPRIKHSPIVGG